MKVVIVGVGGVGRKLADTLSRLGRYELVLVDPDEANCELLAAELDGLVLCGDGTDPQLLKKTGLSPEDALVAATGSDALNTVIAMLGHRLGAAKIIVKLNDLGLRAACQELGVSRIIAPKISAAAEIVATLEGFERLDFTLVERAGLHLEEMSVDAARNRKLQDLAPPQGILVVVVLRGERALLPRGGTKLEENDLLLVLVENEAAADRFRKTLREG